MTCVVMKKEGNFFDVGNILEQHYILIKKTVTRGMQYCTEKIYFLNKSATTWYANGYLQCKS